MQPVSAPKGPIRLEIHTQQHTRHFVNQIASKQFTSSVFLVVECLFPGAATLPQLQPVRHEMKGMESAHMSNSQS